MYYNFNLYIINNKSIEEKRKSLNNCLIELDMQSEILREKLKKIFI